MTNKMPLLSSENLTTEEQQIFNLITNKGRLRATKPSVAKHIVGRYKHTSNPIEGYAAYAWRLLAFQLSPNPVHHCMPMTADFDMVEEYHARRAKCKEIDALCDKLARSVPKSEWHGITRWGRALGY
jgi:hypothetical protein